MIKYIKSNKYRFILSIFLMVLISTTYIFSVYIRSNIVDMIVSKDIKVFKLIIFLLIMLFSVEIITVLLKINNAKIIKKWNINLGNSVSNVIIKMGEYKFKQQASGSYISWYTGDIPLVSSYVFQNTINIFERSIMTIISLFAMFYIDYRLGIISIILLILLNLIGSIFGKRIGRAYRDYAVINSKFNSVLQDFLSGYDVLKDYKSLKFLKKSINKEQEYLEDKMYYIRKFSSFANLVHEGTKKIFEALMFAITGYLVYTSKLNLGMLVVTPQILNIFLTYTSNLFESYIQIKGGYEIFNKLEKVDEITIIDYPKVKDTIYLENISFSYGDMLVLDDLSLEFKKSKKYAIVGESGSGKSTLLKIILGKLANSSGRISIDNNDLKKDNTFDIDFSSEISYIKQDDYMFNLSVRDNILLDSKYDEERIIEVLKEVKIYDAVYSKQNKLDTNINEFSGGEKQRISLARALIRDTPIIVLDEATSALDKKTSKEIEDILLNKKDKTIIMISHHIDDDIKNKFDNIYEIKKLDKKN